MLQCLRIFLFLLVCTHGVQAQTVRLYASETTLQETGSLDRDDGTWTSIGAQNLASGGLTGLAWDANRNRLYGVHPPEARIYSINTTTGAATPIGPVGAFGVHTNTNGLAFDPNTDTLYGTDNVSNALFRIDLSNSSATTIATIAGASEIEGLAFDPTQDILYGLSAAGVNQVYTIDVQTATATALPRGIGHSGLWRGLAFDPDRRVLYATTVGVGGGELYRIDPKQGNGQRIGSTIPFPQGLAMDAPTIAGPQLEVRNLIAGQSATWEASHVVFSRPVIFAISLTGGGPQLIKGVVIDLSPPITRLGKATTNAIGQARVVVPIPNKARGRTLWTQAAEMCGKRPNPTNSLVLTVL